eukprot:gene38147-12102_t
MVGHQWNELGGLPLHAGSDPVRRAFNRNHWMAVERGNQIAVLASELQSPILVQKMGWGLLVVNPYLGRHFELPEAWEA